MKTDDRRISNGFVLGVIGHRYLAEVDRLRIGVDAALDRITEFFSRPSITVVSSLAEGADRLVVQQVLARPGTHLVAALPLPKSDYMADFGTRESKEEFLSLFGQAAEVIELTPMSTRDQSYETTGKYILEHSQVLIAIWDGQPAQGQGGTGALVACARARGLPLAWVHAGNRKRGTLEPTSLGAEQGAVTFERLEQ